MVSVSNKSTPFKTPVQFDQKDREAFILRILSKRDELTDIDSLVFKGIDFEEGQADPKIANLNVNYFLNFTYQGGSSQGTTITDSKQQTTQNQQSPMKS